MMDRYAEWEETQQQWERARSVFERVLVLDYSNQTVRIIYYFILFYYII